VRKRFLSYSLALGLTLLAVFARWLLDPVLGDSFPLITLFGAVAVAVHVGGVGPAVLTSVIGFAACDYLFLAPRGSFDLVHDQNVVGMLASLLTCVIIIGFGEAAHLSRRRFEELARRQGPVGPPVGSIEILRRRHSVHEVVTVGFALTLAVLLASGILGYRNVQRLRTHDRLVSHTHEVIGELEGLIGTLISAETGHRGYLLTMDPRYLAPYRQAVKTVPDALVRLHALTDDNRAQQARLTALRPRVDTFLGELQRSIDRAERQDRPGAEALVAGGKAMMDDLRARVGAMQNAEEALLTRRSAESRESANSAVLWLVLGTLIGVILLGGFFSLTQRNIRLRQSSVEALAEHRELLRVTLASIGEAVITTDLVGEVTYLNAMAEKLTGWTNAEAVRQPLGVVFRTMKEQPDHTVLITKSGAQLPIDDSVAPIRDERGRVAGSVLVFRDITDQKAAEARLHEADRRKDEFLAMLAHELRGPLAPLGNVLEIMKRAEREDGTVRQIRGTIERQVKQLVRLVDDLLDVSRITRGRLELRREPVELGSILRQAIETSRPLADAQDQQVSVTVPPEPIYLEADRARLAQVFYNLLHNASKYTPREGHVWLVVEQGPHEVIVRVRDNGVGIEQGMMATIFEPFRQVPHTLERSQGGLGIGLTLARRLVDMHGGSLTATSGGTGKGSEFTVRLPLTRTLAPPTPAPSRPLATNPQGKTPRVLVVDDNQDSATSLAALLQMGGVETHLAHDGEEAVNAAETLRPEVVLLDIGLPKINGYDVCRRIRSTEWGKDVLVVALTGWGQDEDRRQAREAGFDHHMVKPVDYTALSEVLSRVERPTHA